jgi:hypothetical protein
MLSKYLDEVLVQGLGRIGTSCPGSYIGTLMVIERDGTWHKDPFGPFSL